MKLYRTIYNIRDIQRSRSSVLPEFMIVLMQEELVLGQCAVLCSLSTIFVYQTIPVQPFHLFIYVNEMLHKQLLKKAAIRRSSNVVLLQE